MYVFHGELVESAFAGRCRRASGNANGAVTVGKARREKPPRGPGQANLVLFCDRIDIFKVIRITFTPFLWQLYGKYLSSDAHRVSPNLFELK